MKQTFSLFVESLLLRYMSINRYELDSTWRIPSRRLTSSVLWFVEKGRFSCTVNGQAYQGSEGSVILLPPGSTVACHAISEQIQLISINFDASISFLPEKIWTELLGLPIALTGPTDALMEVVSDMLDISQQNSLVGQLLLQADLQLLIARFLQQILVNNDPALLITSTSSRLDTRVQTVIEYIARHSGRFPSLEELCQLVQISESYLRRLFMEYTALSPLQYIHQYKIELSKKRLVSTDERISDIAYTLGYEDPNYFTRMFKQRTQMTPLQYRAKYQNWIHSS
jgi:AraC-like DNA-binding protein